MRASSSIRTVGGVGFAGLLFGQHCLPCSILWRTAPMHAPQHACALRMCVAMGVVAAAVAGEVLEEARRLTPPRAEATTDGEREGAAFWDGHRELLAAAWREYGPLHEELYTPSGLDALVSEEFAAAWVARDRDAVSNLVNRTAVDDVYSVELFDPAFARMLIEELQHVEASGIPVRRPNGMNRYGAILEDVGLGRMVHHIAARYLAPLAMMLYPEYIRPKDTVDAYGFAIRYQQGEDLSLAAHTDASVFTFNLCLGEAFEGGDVVFYPEGDSPDAAGEAGIAVPSRPGVAVLHRGMLRHAAHPLAAGVRHNVVIWLAGEHGYVRVAPYDAFDPDAAPQGEDGAWYLPQDINMHPDGEL